MTIRERLQGLREKMAEAGLAAYIIPSSDPHQSEYPPDHWKSRSWISGFGGSAGTVVVTPNQAGLWTDSRYYLAAEHALAGTGIELFRQGEPGVVEYDAWLARELSSGDVVGFDALCVSLDSARSLESTLSEEGVSVRPSEDLVGPIWNDRPPLPTEPVRILAVRYAGSSRGEKIALLREQMASLRADYHLICTVDDIAWLLNIRGSDVGYNPTTLCHLLVGNRDAQLFIDERKLDQPVRSELESDGVTILPYGSLSRAISEIDTGAIIYSPLQISIGIADQIPSSVRRIERTNLTTTAKAKKNSVELEHLRNAMIRDGVAMVRFLHWITTTVGTADITELSAEAKLCEFRSAGEHFVTEAFHTISAYRSHGALPHYCSTEESDVRLHPTGLYLVDSGAQYEDGTTDITRTISLGEPSEEERTDFTLVLKGHIALDTLRYPVGTTGHAIDVVARQFLWQRGMNYGHGTGHGVGFHLNVHEGPQRISQLPSDVPLVPGMITSNEPGIYRAERHGVRIENLLATVEDERTEFGQFYRFETLTLCPIDRNLIDVTLLTPIERRWVDDYHRRVRDALLGQLAPEVAEWLEVGCAPLENVDNRLT